MLKNNKSFVKPGRDLELGFELGKGHVKSYFGGAVLPERLEPVLGEVSEEDIANSRSSMIVDFLLCSYCEGRLGKLESQYSTTLKNYSDQEYVNTERGFHSLIFWASVFWRLSASENKHYKLSEESEEKLRLIVDEGLDVGIDDAKPYIEQSKNRIVDMGYKLLRCPGYTKNNNAFIFLDNKNERPYAMLVGEFACFLYMDSKKDDPRLQSFLSLEGSANAAKLNTCLSEEKIFPVAMEVFSEACKQGVEFWKNDFISEIGKTCDSLHLKLIGDGQMHPAIKAHVIHIIAFGEMPLGRRYDMPAIIHAIKITLMYYEPYRSLS